MANISAIPNNEPKDNSKIKIFEDIKNLLTESSKVSEKILRETEKSSDTLENVEKILRNMRRQGTRGRGGNASADMSGGSMPSTGQGSSAQPNALSAPPSSPVTRMTPLAALPDKKESPDWEVVDEVPGRKNQPQLPGPSSTPKPGIGMLGKLGAVAGVGAVLGGLVGLGFDKRSQLPETEQEAAERGVSLSKENQIFSEKPKGLAQVLDEQEAERKKKQKEAAEIGPSRVTREDYQAAQNQAADYKAAGNTMAAAGYSKASSSSSSPVTSRKSYQEIYEEELKLQKGFGTEEQQKSRAAQTARLRYRAQQENEGYQQTQVSQGSSAKPSAKEMQPDDFEQAQQAQAAREAVGRGLRQRRQKDSNPSPTTSDISNSSPSDRSQITPATVARAASDQVDSNSKVSSKNKSYQEIYEEELKLQKGFGTEEQQKSRAAQAARLRYRSQDSSQQSEPTNIQPVKSSAPPQNRDVQSARKEVRDAQERGAELRDVAAAQGMSGKVSGTYEGGQLTKVRDESGREVDVSDKLTLEQKKKVDAARELRAANARSADLQNQVTQSSAENRELNREAPAGQVQPIVVNNNNNMSSQSYVPVQAQPRVPSSFSRLQDRSATY